jgi:hypothetical protein
LTLLLLVLGSAGWLWWLSEQGWTVAKLERLIQAEVPPNAERKSVEAWFVRHSIRYNWWVDTTGDRRGHQTMPEIAGLSNRDLSGMLRGDIDGAAANVGLFSSGRIRVFFFFDKQGNCVGHLVDEFVYCL